MVKQLLCSSDLLCNFVVDSEDGTSAVDLKHGVDLLDHFVQLFNRVDPESENERSTCL